MKIKYYIPSQGDTVEDAEDFESKYNDEDLIAYEIAYELYYNCDGWEWMLNEKTEIVLITGNVFKFFHITVEFKTGFWVEEVKKHANS